MKDNVAVLDINGTEVLFDSAEKASIVMGMIKGVLVSNGYGKEKTWEINDNAEVSLSLVGSSKVLSIDNEEQAAILIDRAKKEKEITEKKATELNAELKREKLFWELRHSAHAKGINDEELRAQLNSTEWYSIDTFKLKTMEG